ncbi:hypothetical protein AB0M34_04605 [Nocardia sp. NPDC050193]
MTTFEVSAASVGNTDEYYVFAPAFGVGRFCQASQIAATAREMIAACGAAPSVFDIEITPKLRSV